MSSPALSQQATPADLAEIERVVKARDTLLGFCEYTFPGYQRAPHLELVAKELEKIEAGSNDRLMVAMPPRHGKTQLVSVRFPAWALGKVPTRRIITASYGERLASAIGRTVRNIVNTQPLFPSVRLASDMRAKDQWETVQGGLFLAVGVGSGVIGFGGDIITIDDPIRKREEAESELMRDKQWDWYTSEIVTREERGTAVVLVMHRWHEDDLAGRLLLHEGDQKEGGRWRVVSLPAIAEPGDELGRKEGEALWPYRRTAEELEDLKHRVQARNWNSLFQQRPTAEDGDIFRWWPRYERLPRLVSINVGIDTAYTEESDSDYTAWGVWGFDGSRAYLMEAARFLGEVPEAERLITAVMWRLKQQNPGIPVRGLVRSSVAIDRIAAQHLRRGVSTIELNDDGEARPGRSGLPVVDVKLPAMGGNVKAALGNLVAVEFEAGRALIPEWAPWLEDWLEEHKQFPFGMHDDFVETTIVAMYYLFSRPAPTRAEGVVSVYGR